MKGGCPEPAASQQCGLGVFPGSLTQPRGSFSGQVLGSIWQEKGFLQRGLWDVLG